MTMMEEKLVNIKKFYKNLGLETTAISTYL